MDRFLPRQDDLTELIQKQSEILYKNLRAIDVDSLGLPYHCQEYFKSSHSTRLFFSIETSAHLLYRSIRLTGKSCGEIVLMDYGAGVGTLYLLAKMIGCKMVIYNDHLKDWKISAEIIAERIGIKIDSYIVGDIEDCLKDLELENISCDIIASRNVIEHIYQLGHFFAAIYRYQPGALVFSSTTANIKNPAARIKHRRWHAKWEKKYFNERYDLGKAALGELDEKSLRKIARATRGLALGELRQAFENFSAKGVLPNPELHGTNTCEPSSGTWAEHIISFEEYRRLANPANYKISFQPGFWDTHYSKSYKNALSSFLNRLITRGGPLSMNLAPFIYVIAQPVKK